MLRLFRPVKIWWHYELQRYPLCWFFFQNDQVNIGDPIQDIMISEYHTIHHTCICQYLENGRRYGQSH